MQNDFIKKVSPIIQAIANEKGLQMVFNAADAGLAWVDPNLDLTLDVIKKLDAPRSRLPAPSSETDAGLMARAKG